MRSRSSAVFASVFLPLVAIYAITAQWGLPYHIDAMTNAITGWYIGNEGTVIASEHAALATEEQYAQLGWFVDSPEGPVGQYPPGAAALAGVAYKLAPDDELEVMTVVGKNVEGASPVTVGVPPVGPATVTAILATAAAAAAMALVFLGFSDAKTATLAGLAFGLATGAWSVASEMSWTHGPAMLGIALALLAAQRERWVLTGLAFAFAILCRPHIAVVAAALGIAVAFRRRSWRPLVEVGISSAVGLAVLLAYNDWLFHELTISGGYGDLFEEQFADAGLGWYAGNVLRGLADPFHGLLPWAPFLLVLIPATVLVRHRLPDWTWGAAIGGGLYLLVQWRANRFTGGDGFSGYRYPIEALTAAAPALFLGYERWVRGRPVAERLLIVGIAAGAVGQLMATLA